MNDAARDEADKGRAAFLADVHLECRDTRSADVFLNVLRRLYSNCSAIYILGDLFEFWAGPAHVEYDDYRYVLSGLQDVLDGAVPVTVLHGNRDFFLGDVFPVGANVTMRRDPFTITLGGRRVYLCHGDLLLSRDKAYRFIRGMFHNRWICAANAMLPAAISYYCASGLRHHSERAVKRKIRTAPGTLAVMPEAVTAIFERGIDVIVSGHVHRQRARFFKRRLPGKPWQEAASASEAEGVLYTLGAWPHAPSILYWSDGAFTFERQAGGEDE